jgi:hypothetical protein
MNTAADSKTIFKFLDAKLIVKRIRLNPRIHLAHEQTLKTSLARYNVTRVELKTFTFSSGPQSLSINQAIVGRIPKLLLFAMIDNKDFLGTITTNPYNFQHFGLRTFNMIVNGRQIPSETLIIDPSHQNTTTLAYKTLFEGTGIHHSNAGLPILHDMYINGYFMLLYDLTPDQAASGHTSPEENSNIRIEFIFKEALKQAIIPGIPQFSTGRFSAKHHHRILKNMDTMQITCALKNVKSFLGAFPSDLLLQSPCLAPLL